MPDDDPLPKPRIRQLLLSLAVAFTVLLSACKNDIQQILAFENMAELPAQSAKNIEILYSDSAQLKLKIFAPQLDRFVSEEETIMDFPLGIRVDFYSPTGEIDTELTANYAQYFETEEYWEVSNDVVVVNREGTVINSEFLTWDMKKEKIFSDKYVKITSDDEIIMGEGFESDQNFIDYEILKPTGIINLETTE